MTSEVKQKMSREQRKELLQKLASDPNPRISAAEILGHEKKIIDETIMSVIKIVRFNDGTEKTFIFEDDEWKELEKMKDHDGEYPRTKLFAKNFLAWEFMRFPTGQVREYLDSLRRSLESEPG